MLGSIIHIIISALVVTLILAECRWVQPKSSKIAFLALVYAWYVATSIWAANTKKIQKGFVAEGVHLFPSASFWLTLLPQVLSCVCITTVALFKRLTTKDSSEGSTGSLCHISWYAAGAGFFFGQLFTVDGLGAGAPGLVFGVKVLEPLSTSLLAIPVLGQRLNARLLAAVLVACAGIVVCVLGAHRGSQLSGDLAEWKVVLCAALANLGFSSRACVMKQAYSQRKISPLDTFWAVNVFSTVCGILMLAAWLLYLAWGPHRDVSSSVLQELAREPWHWFSASFCYFLYQCASILLLDCLMVETHALLVAMKHIFVVILASVLSGSSLNALMIIGIAVASVGVLFYSTSPRDTEAQTELLPHGAKLGQSQLGIPRGLLLTLAAIAALGVLSPAAFK
mmetsp:Transcript_57366/g.167947  ORF Transcript_57366/g.167947 Transcript_57366/m.167947 type:complete len:395 (+) Transcript_57366:61-1245(+)